LFYEALGAWPDYIEHQLVHTVPDPNEPTYNRTVHLAERHKMMQQWANYLDRIKKINKIKNMLGSRYAHEKFWPS
jgi:hypothetical protein